MSESKMKLSTEIFQINTSNIPKLFSYELEISLGNISVIGGKLSYRLRKEFNGHWVWTTSNRLVSDIKIENDKIMNVVKKLWQEQPSVFRGLQNVHNNYDWKPSPQDIADFVYRGLFRDIDDDIRKVLNKEKQDLGSMYVERIYETRGWVVKGKPAISISISSRLIYKQDLKTYASTLPNPDNLIGIWVADKTSTLKGEIVDVDGELGPNRERLLTLTHREKMEELIKNAPDNEMIVHVQTRSGQMSYEYIISALRIIIRPEDFNRFNIDAKKASQAVRIEPQIRYNLLKEIAEVARIKGLILFPYDSNISPDTFITSKDVIRFDPYLKFGGGKILKYDPRQIIKYFSRHGLYKKSNRFERGKPILIGVINALGSVNINNFLARIQDMLRSFHFQSKIIHEERIPNVSRSYLEKAVDSLQESYPNPNIIIAFLPDQISDEDDEWGAYYDLKSLTIGRGIPSQVIYQSTLQKNFAIPNIVLGILGKTGNVPFVLAQPLPYADLVVGIDVARERKKHLVGSINATAIARIYFSNGEFIRYIIHDAPLEGETIPQNVLQRLFPSKEFNGKRVVIHRDGYFRGNEKKDLINWSKKIGARFYLVEIIKTGTPRLYNISNGKVQQPSKGSAFILSDREAFLVSSLPPFKNATPRPLRIRTEPPFTIYQAIHSVLSLTLLHYGSLRPPRIPVTIHYADRIAYLALRGIKPKKLEGNVPFWL